MKIIENISKDKGRKIISGLSTDSRKVKKNFIFLLLKELNQKENFIKNAITNGATVVVCSKNYQAKHKNTVIIKINNVRKYSAKLHQNFT